MRKVWSASTGEYSDYRVNVLFDSREDAEKFCARYNAEITSQYGRAEVEEFTLYEAGDEGPSKSYVYSYSNYVENGQVVDSEEYRSAVWGFHDEPDEETCSHHVYEIYNHPGRMRVTVYGSDHERILKVLGELTGKVQREQLGM